jgi:hypothetical protein
MKALALTAAVLPFAAACQNDTSKNLNDRMERIEKKLDALIAQGPRGGGAGAAPQRPQRQEPDRSKTYAVPIDGDWFEGPADAKITLVEAFDFA